MWNRKRIEKELAAAATMVEHKQKVWSHAACGLIFPPGLCSLSSLKPCFVIPKLCKKKADIMTVGIFVAPNYLVLSRLFFSHRCAASSQILSMPILCVFFFTQTSDPFRDNLNWKLPKQSPEHRLLCSKYRAVVVFCEPKTANQIVWHSRIYLSSWFGTPLWIFFLMTIGKSLWCYDWCPQI